MQISLQFDDFFAKNFPNYIFRCSDIFWSCLDTLQVILNLIKYFWQRNLFFMQMLLEQASLKLSKEA